MNRVGVGTRHESRKRVAQGFDLGALFFREKITVGRKGAAGAFKKAPRLNLLFAELSRGHVGFGGGIPFLQHPHDVVIRKSVGGLHDNARFHARRHLAGGNGKEPVGVDLERDANAGSARRHRRDAPELKARERPAGIHHLALALNHMNRHGGLAVAEGRKVLSARRRNGAVPRNHFFDEPAHGLKTERKGRHVKKEPVVVGRGVAGQFIRLHGGAHRHDAVGVDPGQGLKPKVFLHFTANGRHPGRAADKDDALDVRFRKLRVGKHARHGIDCFVDERLRHAVERSARQRGREFPARRKRKAHVNGIRVRERFLRALRAVEHLTAVFGRKFRFASDLRRKGVVDRVVEVVAAERGVAARREDFKDAAGELQERHVEGAASEVINEVDAFSPVVEPVSEGRSRRF